MRVLLATTALALCAAAPLWANDGFGGLAATGLEFGQTDAVAMEDEDLYISPTEIRVAYVFRNTTDQDVTGEVIFPLPPISLVDTIYSAYNLPEDRNREDLVAFEATVDGQAVPVTIDRIAVIEPEWSESTPVTQQYESPGRDVTADLERFGLPLTADADTVTKALLALPEETRQELVDLGLAGFEPAGEGYGEEAFPLWSLILRYHWTQTFPAGAEVAIAHRYENHPPGGLFYWSEPPEDYLQYMVDRYCIDKGTSKAIVKALTQVIQGETQTVGSNFEMQYILRTANSWAGPIGHFKLTIDKGAPENVVSLCADGVKKTGDTTFVVEKTDYTPDQDLRILVAVPTKF